MTFPHLLIAGPPVILIPPTDTVLNMSHNALLRCQAEADPPNMTYVWMKEGENVYHIEWVLHQIYTKTPASASVRHFSATLSSWSFCLCVVRQISEVSCESDGRWHAAHIRSNPGGFWEIHLHAYERPSDFAHCLGHAYSATYVYESVNVCV